jgi:hypothetical protein
MGSGVHVVGDDGVHAVPDEVLPERLEARAQRAAFGRPRAARDDHDLVTGLDALALQVVEEPEGRQRLVVDGLLRWLLRLLLVLAVRPVSVCGRSERERDAGTGITREASLTRCRG